MIPCFDTPRRRKARTPLPAALLFVAAASAAFNTIRAAESKLEEVTRQPGAYDTWKLALSGSAATDPAAITAPVGFTVERLRSAKPEEDSWVSMAFDPQGRLTIAREKRGLLRMTLGRSGVERVDVLNDTLLECRGLLYAYGCLYVNANNSKVFCRLRDTRGDGSFAEVRELLRSDGGVGHGRNHVVLGPDGMIYLVHGNNVVPPPRAEPDSPLRNFHDDRLIPCPWDANLFDGDVQLPAGHILRTDPAGQSWSLLAGGLRNPFDVAFNNDGEMFTFDADMEWDTGTPWYRPCRINHIISGAEFGWRRGTSKWPEYFPDCGPTVLNIGLASPTGIEFGTKSQFPPEWQKKLFISDWAYGRIIAVDLHPKGAGYSATAEPFITGKPLNVTDVAFGPDGAMYFITGGRRTQSGLYRVRYSGPPSALEPETAAAREEQERCASARALRRHLERFHGHPQAGAVDEIWPHLGAADPIIRHAARIALEWQPVQEWQERALAEAPPAAALTAMMALCRSGAHDAQQPLLAKLNQLDFAALSEDERLLALRDYQLAFIRLGPVTPALQSETRDRLSALYPAADWRENHLLCELLVYLQAPAVVSKALPLIAAATRSEDLLQYLFLLRNVRDGWTLDQRKAYFQALNHAETFEGARDYQRSIRMIRSEVLETLSDAEREAAAPFLAQAAEGAAAPVSTGPQVLVKEWKVDDLAPDLDRVGRGRSFERGKEAFAAAQCILCHRLGQAGGLVGPDLTGVASRFSRRDILDSIINPSHVIDEKYRNTVFVLKGGAQIVGGIDREDRDKLYIRASPLLPQSIPVEKSKIEGREWSPISPMPPGLVNVLTKDQILDLLSFIDAGGVAEPKKAGEPYHPGEQH